MATIFISYARSDVAVAEALAEALEQAGHSVWWDRRITGGAEYSREIEEALGSSEKVIVLWSTQSKTSPWVRDEATSAIEAAKLVPLTIDGTTPPLGFRQFHTIDLSRWLASPIGGLPDELELSLGPIDLPKDKEVTRKSPVRGRQRITFARADDGVTLAYGLLGDGPVLVKAANGNNHLEHELENPLWRNWIEELASRNTLVRYDQRGTGMSAREITDLKFDLLVEDLVAVVNAAGLVQFDLFAISQGCPTAIAFSARYPERVKRLVLVNGFARGWRFSPDRDFVDSWEALCVLARSGDSNLPPGLRKIFTSQYFPGATRAQTDWWNKIQEQSSTPSMALRYIEMLGDFDVTASLAKIRAPTLVMHSKDDQVVSFDAGRFIASSIPGAEFVPLEGRNHLPQITDEGWPELWNELSRFLA
ncbi:hypothetical protein GCM10022276_28860 [Sphingomonas limnosediminicola]|uniref:Alpha/beta fold hydrolase n=1 Tax=Sphingomonas limnosediminicola TaxID=940133 RepID=A0ABP7LWL9_9SPHN